MSSSSLNGLSNLIPNTLDGLLNIFASSVYINGVPVVAGPGIDTALEPLEISGTNNNIISCPHLVISSNTPAVSYNDFQGYTAGGNATGSFNVCMGRRTGFDLTTGQNNTLLGYTTGDKLTTGSANIMINSSPVIDTGNNNIILGDVATNIPSLSNVVVLGNNNLIDHNGCNVFGNGMATQAINSSYMNNIRNINNINSLRYNTATKEITYGLNIADDLAGGSAGSIPYQSSANNTVFLPIGGSGRILTVASGLPSWQYPTPESLYGNGADGYVSFDNTILYPYFASFDGTSTYTLIRDVWATSIFVGAFTTVITAGYRLFAQTSINNNGLIHNNGSNATGSTAGAGGLAGFFKAGGAGATGLLAASAGSDGVAQATPTVDTWVGGVGGRGGTGRASNVTFTGGMITTANLALSVPSNADGGARVTSNFVNYMTRYIVGATNWQMTPSIGGGGGAKSIIGTAATSGGGGGGGGVLVVASPIIFGSGSYRANGGIGGNASGTGGSFGGGGGGGGGICCIIARTIANNNYQANGANGGTSIFTGTGNYPVPHVNGTNTTLTQTLILSPTHALSKGKLYMLTFHLQRAAGVGASGINSVSGYGITWNLISGSRVEYATIASPTRVQETWYGYYTLNEPDLVEDSTITVALSDLNTTARVIMDEISNVNASNISNPITSNIGTNRSNSATALTVTLATAPTVGNCVYSVFTRATGVLPVAGANNTLVNNVITAPLMVSEVNTTGQQANAMTHTTASAIAGFSVEITKTALGLEGSRGWDGKVVRIYG